MSIASKPGEATLADLLRTDIVATANHAGQPVHLVVEVSRTGHSSDVHRAARRAATLTAAGLLHLAAWPTAAAGGKWPPLRGGFRRRRA